MCRAPCRPSLRPLALLPACNDGPKSASEADKKAKPRETIMMRRRCLQMSVAALLLGLPLAGAHAQTYPSRPVTVIADSAPGASPDVAARIVGEALTKTWGQQTAVVNHPGANGSIAVRAAADAPP